MPLPNAGGDATIVSGDSRYDQDGGADQIHHRVNAAQLVEMLVGVPVDLRLRGGHAARHGDHRLHDGRLERRAAHALDQLGERREARGVGDREGAGRNAAAPDLPTGDEIRVHADGGQCRTHEADDWVVPAGRGQRT